jgi:hypothetical protein
MSRLRSLIGGIARDSGGVEARGVLLAASNSLTFLWFIVPLASAGFCFGIASEKGRNRWGWAAFGFFLPIIAIILVVSVPRVASSAAA